MNSWEQNEIVEASDWFEEKHGVTLPPIYLNKNIELSHYCWGGKYGCMKDYHICISTKQDRLLSFFHEAHHILLNEEKGRVVQDYEFGVEEMVTQRAKADVVAFYNRETSEL